MSGCYGTNVSCELILSEGKSICYAVFDEGGFVSFRLSVFSANLGNTW